MKTCTKCGETKPLDQYHRDSRQRDGRHPSCKDCKAKWSSKYYSENRAVIRGYQAKYRTANREKAKRASRDWYVRNRETMRERHASYRSENPQVYWESNYRQRAVRYGFTPVVESFTRADLIARWGDACAHCGGGWDSLDHFPVPVSRGGEHTLDNCRPSCMDCQHQSWRDGFIAKRNPAACKQYGVSESPSKTQAQR